MPQSNSATPDIAGYFPRVEAKARFKLGAGLQLIEILAVDKLRSRCLPVITVRMPALIRISIARVAVDLVAALGPQADSRLVAATRPFPGHFGYRRRASNSCGPGALNSDNGPLHHFADARLFPAIEPAGGSVTDNRKGETTLRICLLSLNRRAQLYSNRFARKARVESHRRRIPDSPRVHQTRTGRQ